MPDTYTFLTIRFKTSLSPLHEGNYEVEEKPRSQKIWGAWRVSKYLSGFFTYILRCKS